jgi:acetyl/propionyl-CoA carboxylase alpha subunit
MNIKDVKQLGARLSNGGKSKATMAIDSGAVRELADLLAETGLTEIEVEHMFDKILIANRGEIALRIQSRLQGARHRHRRGAFHRRRRRHACAARRRERLHRPAAARDSYLNIPALLAACEITGADAVHPGYGFLSENARFAEILEEHGITFIGPKAEHIRLMGDKIAAKRPPKARHSHRAGLRRRVGRDARRDRDRREDRLSGADQGGAGGGGRGMKVARRAGELRGARHRARRGQGRVRRRHRLSREISRRSRATSKSRCSATARAA